MLPYLAQHTNSIHRQRVLHPNHCAITVNEAKLMTKLAPEWVRTSDLVIRSPARYRWTTAPAAVLL